MCTRVVLSLLCGFVLAVNVRAEGLGIRGILKGSDGKAVAGAEVRAQRLDGKGSVAVAITNAKGEYNLRGLTLGAYKVTAVINKVPKSAASINTRPNGWVRVDFDMRAVAGNQPPRRKRYVWVAGETGTHIGSGHWEAVEDTNTGSGASAVERIDGAALRTQPNLLNPAGGVSGPSH
jgi:hypothetical protein